MTPAIESACECQTVEECEAVLQQLARATAPVNADLMELAAVLAEMGECRSDGDNSPQAKGRAEAELRKAEARYRVLVEQIPAITFMAALDEGLNEMYVSPQIEQILGYTQKQWLEDPILWYTRLHPDDRERWHVEFARTCATGERFCAEYRFLAHDGRVVWVHGEAQIVLDNQGRPLFLQGIAFDITVRKQAEEALQRSQFQLEELVQQRTTELTRAIGALNAEVAERKRAEAAVRDQAVRLRSVVETAVDGIVVIDDRGTIEMFNPAAEGMFGYAAHEVLGRNVSVLMPEPYREEHDGYLANYLATGIARIMGIGREVVGRRKDGSTFPVDLAVSQMDLLDLRKFTGVVRDITERKKAELSLARARDDQIMAEVANRAKNEFLSRMSHELRTPLNAILGFSQLLGMSSLSADQRECVQQVTRGGKHLLGLINEVLDIARIETGRLELSLESIRVGTAFREAAALVQQLADRSNVRFEVDLNWADRYYVLADAQKLKQVLLNLLSNAVKYNRAGGAVRLTCEEAAPGRLQLGVTDTGKGIPPDKMSRLFVPFDRLGAEQTGVEGIGLGLTLSKSLVELMGGTLTATSVPGEGSRFDIDLPRAASLHDGAGSGSGEYPKSISITTRDRTVLYVEDNIDNLRLVQGVLSHRPGVHLLTATRGGPGVDLARKHRPDLILLDVHLPDGHGEHVLQRLKDDPNTRNIPVVVLSADATPRQIERLRAAGAREYLTKPIDVPRFLRIVDEILDIGTTDR